MFTPKFLTESTKIASEPGLELARQGLRNFVASLRETTMIDIRLLDELRTQVQLAYQYQHDGNQNLLSAKRAHAQAVEWHAKLERNPGYMLHHFIDLFLRDENPVEVAKVHQQLDTDEVAQLMREELANHPLPALEEDNLPTAEELQLEEETFTAECNQLKTLVNASAEALEMLLVTLNTAMSVIANAANKKQIDAMMADIVAANAKFESIKDDMETLVAQSQVRIDAASARLRLCLQPQA